MAKVVDVGLRIKTENGQAIRGLKEVDQSMEKTKKRGGSALKVLRSGWLQFAAAIGTAVIAVRQALKAVQEAAQLRQINMAFESMADAAGASADAILNSMRELSGGTISTMEIIQSANRAMILGLPIDQLDQLMRIARASATATGSSVKQMFDDIVVGIGRQSRLILDNLGIIVKTSEANATYAQTLGKTAKQLTEVEKRQAFMNAVLREGTRIIERVGKAGQVVTSAERWQILQSAITDLRAEIGQRLLPVFERVSETIAMWTRNLEQSLKVAREYKEVFDEPLKQLERLDKEIEDNLENQRELGGIILTNDEKMTDLAMRRIKLLQEEEQQLQQRRESFIASMSEEDFLSTQLEAAKNKLLEVDGKLLDKQLKMEKTIKMGTTAYRAQERMISDLRIESDELIETVATLEQKLADLRKVEVEEAAAVEDTSANLKVLIEQYKEELQMLDLEHDAKETHIDTTKEFHDALVDLTERFEREGKLLDENGQKLRANRAFRVFQLQLIGKVVSTWEEYLAELEKLNKEEKKTVNLKKRHNEQQEIMQGAFEQSLATILQITEAEEERKAAYMDLLDQYQQMGYEIGRSEEALIAFDRELERSRTVATDWAEKIDEAMIQTLDDANAAMVTLPFDVLQEQFRITADEGASFGQKLGVAFANLAVELTFLLTKMLLLRSVVKAFPAAGESGLFQSLVGLLGVGKSGGEVGKDIYKFARGGAMPGRSGGDVNLGLFHKGEYLVPANRVNARTKPILEGIRRSPRYQAGGAVGGGEIGELVPDIQIINVTTEDSIMSVVDKHKKVIVNYINRDVMGNGRTRTVMRRGL
jgi:hypothetical protein